MQWRELRVLAVTLPRQDIRGSELVGLEKVRVYYLPLGTAQPSPNDVVLKGEVVLEKRRPDLPDPGGVSLLDLRDIVRPAGWIVVDAVRVGDILGVPSQVIPWLDPKI